MEAREGAIDAYAKGMEKRDQPTEAEEKAYEESRRLNTDCAQKLEEALEAHYKDGQLDVDAVLKDMEGYNHSIERISLVLANTIAAKEMSLQGDDDRYSSVVKEWAKNVKMENFFHKDAALSLLHSGEGIESADPDKIMAFAEALQTKGPKEIDSSDLRLGARVTCTVKNGKGSCVLNGVITENDTLKCDKMEFPLGKLREIGVFTEAPPLETLQTLKETHGQNVIAPRAGDTVSGVIKETTPGGHVLIEAAEKAEKLVAIAANAFEKGKELLKVGNNIEVIVKENGKAEAKEASLFQDKSKTAEKKKDMGR